MSTIPAAAVLTGDVNVEDIYDNGLWAPANPPTSLEVLNGGCNHGNYASGDNSIEMQSVQVGTFGAIFTASVARAELVYALTFVQSTSSDLGENQDNRAGLSALGASFFLPWDAVGLLYIVQAWVHHDATEWDHDDDESGVDPEHWDYRIFLDGNEDGAAYGRLPVTRTSDGQADGAGTDGYVDPGLSAEIRFRHLSIVSGFQNPDDMRKGPHKLLMSLWPVVTPPDPKTEKVTICEASIIVLALR